MENLITDKLITNYNVKLLKVVVSLCFMAACIFMAAYSYAINSFLIEIFSRTAGIDNGYIRAFHIFFFSALPLGVLLKNRLVVKYLFFYGCLIIAVEILSYNFTFWVLDFEGIAYSAFVYRWWSLIFLLIIFAFTYIFSSIKDVIRFYLFSILCSVFFGFQAASIYIGFIR